MNKQPFCLGIRLNSNFQEFQCEHKFSCPIYTNTELAEALRNPDKFEEADTYNDKRCDLWQQDNQH